MRQLFCLFFVVISGCIGLPKYDSQPIAVPAEESVDHLALAAECLDRSDSKAAVLHLSKYVRENPDHVMIRSLLAEQLMKLGNYAEAKMEFERTADEYRTNIGKHRESLVQCHTRLMQIAQEKGDEPMECFHRGAGLYLMAEGWDLKTHDAKLTERTLTQAMENLREAAEKKPNDAQAQLLFGDVLSRIGQHSAAKTAYRKALALPPGSLTEAEKNRLEESTR